MADSARVVIVRALGAAICVTMLFQFAWRLEPDGDAPTVALGAGAYYALSAVVLVAIVHAQAHGRPAKQRFRGVAVWFGMVVIGLCAVNLLFLTCWVKEDAAARMSTDIEYLRGIRVGLVVIPLGFVLGVLNLTCLPLAIARLRRGVMSTKSDGAMVALQ